jgi:RNA polymerase sigma-70 factor (ECF subfamily)
MIETAFTSSVMALRPRMKQMAWKLAKSKDGADDLLQETYMRAFRFRHQFKDGTKLAAWLYTIMTNAFKDECNKAKRRRGLPNMLPFYSEAYTPVDPVELKEVFAVLDEMPAKFASALIEIGTGAYYKQAAHDLGVADGTVKSRVSRGRAILVKRLGAMV